MIGFRLHPRAGPLILPAAVSPNRAFLMGFHPRPICASVCALVAIAMPLSAGASAATSEQVQKAIDKGQAFLLANRNAQGNWEEVDEPEVGKEVELRTSTQGRQWGGLSALSTYALLASGKDARDPELAEPIKFLLHANIESTYAAGPQLAVGGMPWSPARADTGPDPAQPGEAEPWHFHDQRRLPAGAVAGRIPVSILTGQAKPRARRGRRSIRRRPISGDRRTRTGLT